MLLKDSVEAKKVDHYDISLEVARFDWEVPARYQQLRVELWRRNSGTGVGPNHIYNMSGHYTVVLKVTDNAGNFNTYTAIVSVEEPFNQLILVIIGVMISVLVGAVIYSLRKRKSNQRNKHEIIEESTDSGSISGSLGSLV